MAKAVKDVEVPANAAAGSLDCDEAEDEGDYLMRHHRRIPSRKGNVFFRGNRA